MKRIFLFVFVIFLASTTSCKDEELDRLSVKNIKNGAILRTVSKDIKKIDLNNLSASNSSITVEFDDFKNHDSMKSVDYFVEYQDTKPDANGKLLKKPEVKLGTIEASTFKPTEGKPRATINFNATEVLSTLGLTSDLLDDKNVFIFRLALNMNDGRVFSSNNVKNSVASSSAFKTPFRYSTKVKK